MILIGVLGATWESWAMNIYELFPHPLGWQVRRRGHRMADAVRATRESAMAHAEALARLNRPSVIITHTAEGSAENVVQFDPPRG